MPEGDESLWYCYFTQELFFKAFFKEISFQMDLSTTPVPTVSSIPTIAPIATPTPEVTPIPTPTPLPCDRKTGGEGCFGQSWDGKWWTLEEEKSYALKGEALFVPSKAYYRKPTDTARRPIVIFSGPGGAETYWITGDEPDFLGAKAPEGSCYSEACRSMYSMRGDVTYMMRLPTGKYSRHRVQLTHSNFLSNEWVGWFSALSFSPDTTISYSTTPTGFALTGEPDCCLGIGIGMAVSFNKCKNLEMAQKVPPEYNILYLKIQVAPSSYGIQGSQCGKTIHCQLRVVAQ